MGVFVATVQHALSTYISGTFCLEFCTINQSAAHWKVFSKARWHISLNFLSSAPSNKWFGSGKIV